MSECVESFEPLTFVDGLLIPRNFFILDRATVNLNFISDILQTLSLCSDPN
jgi:hypothetical protein